MLFETLFHSVSHFCLQQERKEDKKKMKKRKEDDLPGAVMQINK